MKIGIVGLGLIGGSFAKALSKGNATIFAWNRSKEPLELAFADSTVHEELDDANIPKCDLIILTTFPKHCINWLEEKAPLISKDTIVIDAAGTKRIICEKCFNIAEEHDFTFIGAHPMAGTQYSGYENATCTMFEGAPLVLVPPANLTDIERVEKIDKIKLALSACKFGKYTISTPEEHDRIIAYTSQLAHVVSSSYANNPLALKRRGFSAGSWKDLTRVAWLNPSMWSELFLENSENLINVIDHTIENLNRCRNAIANNDKHALEEFLAEGDKIKRESEKE